MPSATCRICAEPAHPFRELRTGRREPFEVYACDRCACLFLEPQPTNERLAEEYARYYERRSSGMTRPRKGFFRSVLRDTGLDLSGKAVLEIGSAEGDCVAAINELWPTARVTAIEANPDSAAHHRDLACEHRSVSLEGFLEDPPATRFDVLLAFDVLEHVRDPVATLRDLMSRCASSGAHLVATFPNADGLSRKLLGGFWPQYKAEHLFYFSRGAVGALGSRAGLTTLSLKPLAKELPVEYLLSVGSNFGPAFMQSAVGAGARLIPAPLKRAVLRLRLGEWVWHATTS